MDDTTNIFCDVTNTTNDVLRDIPYILSHVTLNVGPEVHTNNAMVSDVNIDM